MMIDEEVVTRLLHDAAGRIPVPSQLDAVLADTVLVPVRADQVVRRRRRLRFHAAVAACLLAAAAVGGLLATSDDGPPAFAGPPTPVPAGAPAPGAVAPFVAAPPAWVGKLGRASRPAGDRSGRWVTAAFGVVDGDVVRRPITVAAFDGGFDRRADAEHAQEIEVDGTRYRSLRYLSWQALFTMDQPAVMVTGLVDGPSDTHLASVAAEAHARYDAGGLTLTIDRLPAGYSLIVPPQALAEDTTPRSSAATRDGVLAVHDLSDMVDPLLAAAMGGVDLQRVDVGGRTGWYSRNPMQAGLLASLTWSPRPGVVFEVVTTDVDRSPQQLVALAAATEAMPIEEWKVRCAGLCGP
jgi:hypothetical protein